MGMRCQDPISTVILAQKVLELFENPIVDSLKMDLEKLGKGSKKNLEFSRFNLTHHPLNLENSSFFLNPSRRLS